ncbi:type II toxin-antitoxin system RelE/ParE family toxin [Achromobacter insolitus]|uniref:type II toxin-antitoxin system RelE/ParE family toxin n=1 Tax=Achromobacter insolitus TaxID=217204 RepID=UPI001748608A|nr:type II toxin-antitoxin system RelE/ParE family toxin [Achromobacter insolitus]
MWTSKPKLLFWEGSSRKDFKTFPVPVQKRVGMSLYTLQCGRWPDAAKAMKGRGSGVYELVDTERGNAYRTAYAMKIDTAIHVLHAFRKKSRSGISTPQSDLDLISRRLKRAMARQNLARSAP